MPQQTDKQFVDGQELLKLASLVKKNACSTELLIYLSHDRFHGSILALPKVGPNSILCEKKCIGSRQHIFVFSQWSGIMVSEEIRAEKQGIGWHTQKSHHPSDKRSNKAPKHCMVLIYNHFYRGSQEQLIIQINFALTKTLHLVIKF